MLPTASTLLPEAAGALAFSPDSRIIAFVTDVGYINTYDVETRALNRILPVKMANATGLAIDPDGSEISMSDSIGNIWSWNLNNEASGEVLTADRAAGGGGGPGFPWSPRNTLVYSADGRYITSGSTQGVHPLRLWDQTSNRAVAVLQREGVDDQGNTVFLAFNSAAFNTDATLLVTTVGDLQSLNGEIVVWDVQSALENGVEMQDTFPAGELVSREPLISLPLVGANTAVFNAETTLLAAAGSDAVTVWGLP